jgi:hypothetical protein
MVPGNDVLHWNVYSDLEVLVKQVLKSKITEEVAHEQQRKEKERA